MGCPPHRLEAKAKYQTCQNPDDGAVAEDDSTDNASFETGKGFGLSAKTVEAGTQQDAGDAEFRRGTLPETMQAAVLRPAL